MTRRTQVALVAACIAGFCVGAFAFTGETKTDVHPIPPVHCVQDSVYSDAVTCTPNN